MIKRDIAVAALIFILGFGLCFLWMKDRSKPDDSELIDRLIRHTDSLCMVNNKLNAQYDSINHLIDTIQSKVIAGKTTIIYLKERKDEAIKHIGILNGNQLYDFWSTVTTHSVNGK